MRCGTASPVGFGTVSKMATETSRRLRSGSVMAVSMGIMNLSTYGYTVIAAHTIGKEPYGAFSALMGALLVISVLSLGLQATGARRISAHPDQVVAIERAHCQVLADGEALEQALVHLVQNAVDAGPEGSPVFLDVRTEGTNAVIEVIDSGSGMSPEFVRTRLFKPFHSSKPGGFGIGAFEAREMVRAMGGWLDVESREGLGTRFLVRLPLAGPADLIRTFNSSPAEVA